ncbi:bifunctional oligoribonuclease/PAP phosphatase NrnA [Deinococcus sp.]|uniref:DHH family phosphoesterase n=1 Tax=Deinococcus sp. TaxID=47478 RepID=UPI002869AA88|nr:bifunctional oligoribonuclease/PAP phosphatase NrnA [Deinococcus sp.]
MTASNASSTTYPADVHAVAAAIGAHTGPLVLLAHENPDGDALGSVLGLARALRSAGREVIAPLDVPRYLKFMTGEDELCAALTAFPEDALVVVLDVDNNDPARVAGAPLADFDGPTVNIDHHGTNRREALAVVVDPARPATAMIVADVIDAMGIPWSEAIATPLMLGLNTDTGSFRFSSVTPETFGCAGRLLAHGARLAWLNDELGQHPHSYYTLLREVLSTLEFQHDGRVVLARVDDTMLARAGATWEDVESYVSLLRSAEGAQLAVMVKDFGERVKLSLRSRQGVSAQNVAVELGGGGHVLASGATVSGSYAILRERLNRAIQRELNRADSARA